MELSSKFMRKGEPCASETISATRRSSGSGVPACSRMLGLGSSMFISSMTSRMSQVRSVGGVVSLGVDAADGDQLPETGVDPLVGHDPALEIVGVVVLYPVALQHLLGLSLVEPACVQVRLEEGVQILVEAAVGEPGTGIRLRRS